MAAIFLKLFNMSIAAGWLILAVLVLRLLLKKAPKWVSCLLWAIVAVRLVSPFSLESGWSLIPSAETIVSNVVQDSAVQDNAVKDDAAHDDAVQGLQNGIVQNVQSGTVHNDVVQSGKSDMVQGVQSDLQDSVPVSVPIIHSGVTVIDRTVNSVLSESFAADSAESGTGSSLWHYWTQIASVIWLSIAGCILLYALIGFLRLKRKVRASIRLHDNVYVCDEIPSPFILGIIKPHVYLPSGMDSEMEKYVIAHENTHLHRLDHWWKPFGYILLAVYWFHPLSWVAYILFCRDMELACDERAVQTMEREDKAAYAQALLDCSFPRRMVVACPLAFGEIGVKERVKAVLNYKRPAFWIIIVALIACVAVAVCFLTNPKEADSSMDELVKKGTDVVSTIDIKSNSKETPKTGDENSIPTTNDSGFFVVGASVEDKQDFDPNDKEVREALNAYQSVLTGQADFRFWSHEYKDVKNLSQLVDFMAPQRTGRFAVINLDNDDLPEFILSFMNSDQGYYDEKDFFIFKYDGEQVFVFPYTIDGFGQYSLKQDGTFRWTNGEDEYGIAIPLFQQGKTAKKDLMYTDKREKNPSNHKYYINGLLVTRLESEEAYEYQFKKRDVSWYDFSEREVKKFFSIGTEDITNAEETEKTADTVPSADGFIPDPPVTTAKSDDFVTGAPVIDKQIFWKDSQVIEALNAYRAVFTGQLDFCFYGYGSVYESEVRNLEQLEDYLSRGIITTFAVIDLDNDSLPEAILSFGFIRDSYCIFKYHEGHVYAYEMSWKYFSTLKMDGTMFFSDSIGTLVFRGNTIETDTKVSEGWNSTEYTTYYIYGQRVTKEEGQAAYEYQRSKPYVTWHDFLEKDIEQYFGSWGL